MVEVWHGLRAGARSSASSTRSTCPSASRSWSRWSAATDVANAVALNSAVFNLTRIIGPAIAGITIATIGLAPLFFVNAASYVAVIVGAGADAPGRAACRRQRAPWSSATARSVVDALVEGLRYVRNEPRIFLAISVLGVVATFALNFQVDDPGRTHATCSAAMPTRTAS